MKDHPTDSIKFFKFSFVFDEGEDEDEELSSASLGSSFFWLFLGAALTFSAIKLGFKETMYAIIFAVVVAVVGYFAGVAAKKKVAHMEKFSEGEKAVDPDLSELGDIDLDLY